MVDWAGWGTSIGTLVLAGATFAAIRSSNQAARSAERSARLAERSLLATLRPLLIVAQREDPGHEIQFADGRVLEMKPGEALFRPEGEVIYLALSLRNVGTGIAHLRGYRLEPETQDRVRADPLGPARHRRGDPAPDPDTFADQRARPLRRAGRYRVLAGRARDPGDPVFKDTEQAHRSRGRLTVDVLYGDLEDGQPTVTAIRFASRTRRDLALRHYTPLAKPRPRRVARAPAAEATAGAAGRQAGSQFVPRAHCRRDLR